MSEHDHFVAGHVKCMDCVVCILDSIRCGPNCNLCGCNIFILAELRQNIFFGIQPVLFCSGKCLFSSFHLIISLSLMNFHINF